MVEILQQLEKVNACREQKRLERDVEPIFQGAKIDREWYELSSRTRYAWLFFAQGIAAGLVVRIAHGSIFSYGAPGTIRALTLESGAAAISLPESRVTLLEGDRIWVEPQEPYLVEPLTPELGFELIMWPLPREIPVPTLAHCGLAHLPQLPESIFHGTEQSAAASRR